MLGSLYCMHWRCKNCLTAWAGQYSGRSGAPTIILNVVVDYDLQIWHAYFGMAGSNNDINVLESSRLFSNLAQGIAPLANYMIQENEQNMGYYLADSIYPKWSTIVQTIQQPQGPKKKYFSMRQVACRKDVERAIGVLQARFAIIAGPIDFWCKEVFHDIISSCIIMHNMIIEDECDLNALIEQVKHHLLKLKGWQMKIHDFNNLLFDLDKLATRMQCTSKSYVGEVFKLRNLNLFI